jgi:two-component system chemotaxis sensor kinase CheA
MMVPLSLPDALVARFRKTAFERLEVIDSGWSALTTGSANVKTEQRMFQELHTLKGDARVVGFGDVAVLCQRLEDLLAAARRRRYRVHDDVDVVATMAIQFIGMLLRRKGGIVRSGIDLEGFLAQIEQVVSEWLRQSSETPEAGVRVQPRFHGEGVQRLTSDARARLCTVATTVYLEYLRATGRPRARLREAWDILEREIGELETSPLGPLLARHAASAKELASDLGKVVEVSVDVRPLSAGTDVFDALNAVALHALRNAVDHGIEPPAVRERSGKPAVGTVRIQLRQSGDLFDLEIADDGAGVDLDAVKAKAERVGLLAPDRLATASEGDLIDLLFSPSFSTRDAVTEVSGLGVGLDAVRAVVERLGGHVSLSSTRGSGTTLRALVPNRRAFVPVRAFRVLGADVTFAIDADWVIVDDASPAPPTSDLLEAIDFTVGHASSIPAQRLVLERNGQRIAIATDGSLWEGHALRVCPTPAESEVEVVKLADFEALLVRPDVLFGSRGKSRA